MDFLRYFCEFSTLLHLPPLRFHLSEDAGIEPRTVATFAFAVRRSKNPATVDLIILYNYFSLFSRMLLTW